MSACEEAVHADDLLLALNGDMGAAARVRERQRERRRQHGHGLQAALHESRSPASAASVVAPPGAAAASTASAAVCARASTRACSTTGAASEAPSDLLQWALRGEAVWVQGDEHSLQAVGEPMGEPGAVQLRAAPGAEELLASMHAIGKRAAYATTNLQPTCPLLAAQPQPSLWRGTQSSCSPRSRALAELSPRLVPRSRPAGTRSRSRRRSRSASASSPSCAPAARRFVALATRCLQSWQRSAWGAVRARRLRLGLHGRLRGRPIRCQWRLGSTWWQRDWRRTTRVCHPVRLPEELLSPRTPDLS